MTDEDLTDWKSGSSVAPLGEFPEFDGSDHAIHHSNGAPQPPSSLDGVLAEGFITYNGTLYRIAYNGGVLVFYGVGAMHPDPDYRFPDGSIHEVSFVDGDLLIDGDVTEVHSTPPSVDREFDNLRYYYDADTDTHALVVDNVLVSGSAEPFEGMEDAVEIPSSGSSEARVVTILRERLAALPRSSRLSNGARATEADERSWDVYLKLDQFGRADLEHLHEVCSDWEVYDHDDYPDSIVLAVKLDGRVPVGGDER